MADFSGVMTFRASPATLKAMDTAANKRGMKSAEWLRNAVATGLALDGVSVEPRDAGSLYDKVEGRQRYALVRDGEVVSMDYRDAHPGDGWLPVEHQDSAPFNLATHWRLKPIVELAADKVVVLFPIVIKSWEHA